MRAICEESNHRIFEIVDEIRQTPKHVSNPSNWLVVDSTRHSSRIFRCSKHKGSAKIGLKHQGLAAIVLFARPESLGNSHSILHLDGMPTSSCGQSFIEMHAALTLIPGSKNRYAHSQSPHLGNTTGVTIDMIWEIPPIRAKECKQMANRPPRRPKPLSHLQEGNSEVGQPGKVAEVLRVRSTTRARFPIVGIVASAGGLEAFTHFFEAMPSDSGMAFVLVPHLDAKHKSLMADLIGRQTAMPVSEAKDETAVEANHVYVIPPNHSLSIDGGRLRLGKLPELGGSQTAIDLFLRSLAADQGVRAIGIVLSGTGSHGTLGVREIKNYGGLAIAQSLESAEFDQMPRSAIETGLVDFVLPPEQMPETLVRYTQSAGEEERPDNSTDNSLVSLLEFELKTTRDELQNNIEQMSFSNEELQSSNEELESSKEELQSLNEELNTVNCQLLEKVAELDQSNSEISNLMASTRIAALFLDKNYTSSDLRVRLSSYSQILRLPIERYMISYSP